MSLAVIKGIEETNVALDDGVPEFKVEADDHFDVEGGDGGSGDLVETDDSAKNGGDVEEIISTDDDNEFPSRRHRKANSHVVIVTPGSSRTADGESNQLQQPEHCGTKPGHFETSKIHFPTSEGVSEVSERANE